jgi:hypothetical protein
MSWLVLVWAGFLFASAVSVHALARLRLADRDFIPRAVLAGTLGAAVLIGAWFQAALGWYAALLGTGLHLFRFVRMLVVYARTGQRATVSIIADACAGAGLLALLMSDDGLRLFGL